MGLKPIQVVCNSIKLIVHVLEICVVIIQWDARPIQRYGNTFDVNQYYIFCPLLHKNPQKVGKQTILDLRMEHIVKKLDPGAVYDFTLSWKGGVNGVAITVQTLPSLFCFFHFCSPRISMF